MVSEEEMIEKVKGAIEAKLNWGDSSSWSNSDFVTLSEMIKEETKATLSHVTLKRVWGKVKYNSLPNQYTLNTLAQVAGYECWRDFKVKNLEIQSSDLSLKEPTEMQDEALQIAPDKSRNKVLKVLVFLSVVVVAALAFFFLKSDKSATINEDDYQFSSSKVVTEGLPNTVVFDFDASKAPTDSVIIQQSWDKSLQATVSKKQRQHTSIYYLPDYYNAKLIVGNKVVKRHDLLIKSDGWLTAILQGKIPIYIKKEEAITDGKISLPVEAIKAQNVSMVPEAPWTIFSNVKDFGPIYSDHFVFETRLKNDFKEGRAFCQKTTIYLLCKGTAIGIPLSQKGCVSDLDLLFTNYFVSGKKQDLSAFGTDFNDFINVKVESKNGKAAIFLNDHLAYNIEKNIMKSQIIGVEVVFQGTGSVDFVSLSNGEAEFKDDFESR
jgi:hypothetical protein